jgi:hypothetical protein
MAVIKVQNFLRLSEAKRTRIWNELRDEPYLQFKVTSGDLGIPFLGLLRWSVSAHGVVIFLIGDDPKKV